jgi:micrococcal nuclease
MPINPPTAALLRAQTSKGSRGFESHPLRQKPWSSGLSDHFADAGMMVFTCSFVQMDAERCRNLQANPYKSRTAVVRQRFTAMRLLALLPLLPLLLFAPPATAAEPFVLCKHGAPAKAACVVDGDTFWLEGEKIRAMGFDAPEMGPPHCPKPGPLARTARARVLALLNVAPPSIERHGLDPFGRTLAVVSIDGRELGGILIGEGLARPYVPGETPWCR